ncbi:PAS domain-containing protein [Thalassobaculum sp.]|uniref:PAS domain-containing protein n=1 Tax=Thalassobaculum sp. TaxID=2022740 RepID=UPI0032EE5C85
MARHAATASQAATASDWRYATCALEVEPRLLGPFGELVALWQDRRRDGRPLPMRDDFDITDFAPWLGRIFVARIEHDPFDIRFTLWGTQLRDWWRVDYTGRTLGELSADPQAWRVERDYFQAMYREPFLGIASGYLSQYGRDHVKLLGLDLPLSDGAGMTQILSAHLQIGLSKTVEDVLPDCPLVSFAEDGG